MYKPLQMPLTATFLPSYPLGTRVPPALQHSCQPLTFPMLSSSHRSGSSRHEPSSREPGQHFGGPPPLISPKPQHHPVTTSLWNPVSLMENPPDPPRRLPEPHSLHSHSAPFEPSRQGIPLVKVERVFCPEKLEEGARKRDTLDKYPPGREPGAPEHGVFSHTPFLAELEKSTQSILSQQRPSATPFTEATKPSSPYRPPQPRAQDPMYIYDEFVQQHRRLVSKLDLEERRRREAREKGELLGVHHAGDPPQNQYRDLVVVGRAAAESPGNAGSLRWKPSCGKSCARDVPN